MTLSPVAKCPCTTARVPLKWLPRDLRQTGKHTFQTALAMITSALQLNNSKANRPNAVSTFAAGPAGQEKFAVWVLWPPAHHGAHGTAPCPLWGARLMDMAQHTPHAQLEGQQVALVTDVAPPSLQTPAPTLPPPAEGHHCPNPDLEHPPPRASRCPDRARQG